MSIDSVFCLAFPAFLIIFLFFLKVRRYYKTPYARSTGNSYFEVMNDKGRYGEFALAKQIYAFDPEGKVYFNVYVPKDDGTTSEIDAVYIAPWGIVVFENKNYSGWIFGKAKDPRWTQTLNRHTKNGFMNPIKQNAAHIKALATHLNLPVETFVPLVVFADKTVFKNLDAGGYDIVHTRQVPSVLERIKTESTVTFPDDERIRILKSVYTCARADEATKRRHIENVLMKKYGDGLPEADDDDSKAESEHGRCPRCGSNLVLRTSRKGKCAGKQFYGCSRFPRFRYTQDCQE